MSKPDKKSLEYRTKEIARLVAELRKQLPVGAKSIEIHVKFHDDGEVKVEGRV